MINANLSAFSVGKAVGRGGGVIPLQWANDNSKPYIAWSSGASIYFAVPIADSSTSPNQWQFSNNGGASWSTFTGAAIIYAPVTPLIFNGVTYTHYARSPPWSAGNFSYIQRFGGGALFGGATSGGETQALGNNAGNYS
jgi:hypothetical protein